MSAQSDGRPWFLLIMLVVIMLFALVGCSSAERFTSSEDKFDLTLYTQCLDNLSKAKTDYERSWIISTCTKNSYVHPCIEKGFVSDTLKHKP